MSTIILALIGIILYETCELLRLFYGDDHFAPDRAPYGHDFLYR